MRVLTRYLHALIIPLYTIEWHIVRRCGGGAAVGVLELMHSDCK